MYQRAEINNYKYHFIYHNIVTALKYSKAIIETKKNHSFNSHTYP